MVMTYQDKYDHFVMKWKVVSNQSGLKRTSINNIWCRPKEHAYFLVIKTKVSTIVTKFLNDSLENVA